MVTDMRKAKPAWSNVKSNLVEMDRHTLFGLIRDLYAASKENQAFLHARFGLGGDVLKPYKKTMSRWVCPDVMRNQNYSVSRARKAISDVTTQHPCVFVGHKNIRQDVSHGDTENTETKSAKTNAHVGQGLVPCLVCLHPSAYTRCTRRHRNNETCFILMEQYKFDEA